MLHALQQALGSSLGGELSRALRLSVPRTAIDQHLVELLHTFDLHAPVPSMKVPFDSSPTNSNVKSQI